MASVVKLAGVGIGLINKRIFTKMATATATKRRSRYGSFSELRDAGMFEKPLNKRPELNIGRKNSKQKARNYGLLAEDVVRLKAMFEAGDPVPNPHNRTFNYYLVEALKALGLNRNHSSERVIDKFKELASVDKNKKTGKTFWSTWKNKESRNKATGRNWLGRFEQNVEVLQRVEIPGRDNLHPYGQRLLDVGRLVLGTKGVTIDVVYGSDGKTVMYRLNTDNAIPVNETKRRGKESAEAPATPAKSRKARKTAAPAAPEAVVSGPVVEATPETVAEPTEPTTPVITSETATAETAETGPVTETQPTETTGATVTSETEVAA